MSFKPEHLGLTFNTDHLEHARNARNRSPLKAAWERLDSAEASDSLADLYWHALRYRFESNVGAGTKAINLLLHGPALPNGETFLDTVKALFLTVQCFEMVRDHPACEANDWLRGFRERLEAFKTAAASADIAALDRLWLTALNMGSAVMLEDEALFEESIHAYQAVVDDAIHPDGYVRPIVEGKGEDTLLQTTRALSALALTAEIACHAGHDLWAYNNRGVSIATAATYLLYYYYYPEKWRWGGTLTPDDMREMFRQHGAFMELIHRRLRLRVIDTLLDEQRPMFDLTGGGLTTLTHAKAKRRGLFG